MSTAEILGLGAIAGFTIFLGLPIGRMQNVRASTKAFLAAIATGVLIFLLWDVLAAAVEPVETALTEGHDGRFAWLAFLLTAGFTVGLMSLVYYGVGGKRRRRRAFLGPGAASTAEYERDDWFTGLSPARWLAIFIATGIGLHNFSEGLAIGQSAASGEIQLAIVLIIGFGLHNATEGLGICAPLAGDEERPSWAFLAVLGLIGGGPTFLGTALGQAWVSDAVSIVFLALAAGSILYVVLELVNVCRALAPKTLMTWGILLGLFLGFATDFILVAAGA
jgi:zinc transporter, ZIP family